jgi:hypothetical protein
MQIILVFLFLFSVSLTAQSYVGPVQGSVTTGYVVNTSSFGKTSTVNEPKERYTRNKEPMSYGYDHIDFGVEPLRWQDIYQTDESTLGKEQNDSLSSIMLRSFDGIPMGNSIPPDPYIAAGPNHIMLTVNTSFAIYDKQGNHLKTIAASNWYNSTGIAANSPFDPKVVYDHYANRWIMVWLNTDDASQTAYFLVSVSDDSDPMGVWHNWALPSHLNGSVAVNNWGDYQGVGFDSSAIYITSNQFTFAPYSFQYPKLRIVPKAALLAATPGSVSWFDMYNIRVPVTNGQVFTLRPTITYGTTTDYPLVYAPQGGNFMTVYKISNAATNPALTGVNIPVTPYNSAPQANQLGGSTPLLESGGGALKFEPIYRDGSVYIIHSIANPQAFASASLHYLKLNVVNNTKEEEIIFGAPNYWYIYPAIAVDKNHNVALSFSRSSLTEYVGAYYTIKKHSNPSTLAPTRVLQTGKSNYNVTFGGTRNRWGDYNGIWLDPSNEESFWMYAEYAAPANRWGTWVAEVRVAPYSGPSVYTNTGIVQFNPIELGFESDPQTVFIQNFGTENLIISNIPENKNDFKRITSLTFPITLAPYEYITFDVTHEPTTAAIVTDTFSIASNDPSFSGIVVKGRGFQINPALGNTIYSSTGTGNVLTLNQVTGIGTEIGNSNYSSLTTIAVNPKTSLMFGIRNEANSARIVRINSLEGDAYTFDEIPFTNVTGASFDTTGMLFIALRTGFLYRYDVETKELTYHDSVKSALSTIAFNPKTNELWGGGYRAVGVGRDKIIKINLSNGDTTLVGITGFGVLNNDLEFDAAGNLYGIKGGSTQINDLFSVNLETGAGTLIGASGIQNLTSIAINSGIATSIKNNNKLVPTEFALSQNYPNPFNPSTIIEYALPIEASVKLSIYNILGEEVKRLFNGNQIAGNYKVSWNGDDNFGYKLSSGIYFYELRGNDNNGKEFSLLKKMILMK